MNSNILLSFGLVALLSLNTYHALSTQEKDEQYVSFNDDMESDDDTNMSLDSRSTSYIGLPYKYYGDILFVMDLSFIKHFGGRSTARYHVNNLLIKIDQLFKKKSLGVWMNWGFGGFRYLRDSQVSVYGNYRVKQLARQQLTTADVIMFLTFQPTERTRGWTMKNGGICNKDNADRAVVVNYYENTLKTARNAAQRIGYLLGMQRERLEDNSLRPCANNKYFHIMGLGMEATTYEWTPCNSNDFLDFYIKKRSNFCLKTEGTITN